MSRALEYLTFSARASLRDHRLLLGLNSIFCRRDFSLASGGSGRAHLFIEPATYHCNQQIVPFYSSLRRKKCRNITPNCHPNLHVR